MEGSHTGERVKPADRRFLEALCMLRGLYAHRGPRDRLAVATVPEVIESAEARLRVRHADDERLLRRFVGGPRWPGG